MKTIFSKIIDREIPAEIIYEDEYTIVIPDKFPSLPGQLLVISKRPVSYIFSLDDVEYQALMNTTKKVARALDLAFSTLRTCVVIEGFEVPHVHVRLYPCKDEHLILEPRSEATNDELKALASVIKEELLITK